jgi:CRP-like cAMP-binding protein
MHDSILKYLAGYTPDVLTESEIQLVKAAFAPLKIKKRHYFLREGEVCRHFAFIVSGAMRQYLVDDRGVEHIVHLGLENWWVGDRESWAMGSPTVYCIDAWEDTEVLLITRENHIRLMDQVPAFNKVARILDDRNKIANQRRITSSISLGAEKRYADFKNCYPEFLLRFPQHVIASYLGITKETLSRVRKQALPK